MSNAARPLEAIITDPYEAMHGALVSFHRAIQAEFANLLAVEPADHARIVTLARNAGGFLLGHHHAESAIVFPALRRSGIMRSTDISFLEGLEPRASRAPRDLATASSPRPTRLTRRCASS